MFFTIDPSNGLAIYDQVVRQVVFAVAAGALQTGDAVPSVRELARELAINPNTVARAYRQLQDDRVLKSVRGTGLVVAEGVWWAVHAPGDRTVNALTSQRLTDLGGGSTFYDNRVDVRPAR